MRNCAGYYIITVKFAQTRTAHWTGGLHFDAFSVSTTNVDGCAQAHALQRVAAGAQQVRVAHARERAAHVKADAGDHVVVPLYEDGVGNAGS